MLRISNESMLGKASHLKHQDCTFLHKSKLKLLFCHYFSVPGVNKVIRVEEGNTAPVSLLYGTDFYPDGKET